MRYAALAILLSEFSAPAVPAELELRYPAIERVLAEQVFTQEGRLYVRGNKNTKCTFAYLASPHLAAAEGRLRLTARFSGRSALDMFGRCVGLGDSFDFTVTATPVVRGGALALEQVKITTSRDSYYIGRVRQALAASFAKDFKIEVKEQARRLLEQPVAPTDGKAAYERELRGFDLRDARAEADALLLVIDFRLAIK
jgi:hypothetical protein